MNESMYKFHKIFSFQPYPWNLIYCNQTTTSSEVTLPVCPLKILCFIEEIIYYWEYDFSSTSFIRALKSSSSCAETELVLKLLSGVKIIIEIIFKANSQVLLKLFFKLNLNYKSGYR